MWHSVSVHLMVDKDMESTMKCCKNNKKQQKRHFSDLFVIHKTKALYDPLLDITLCYFSRYYSKVTTTTYHRNVQINKHMRHSIS